MKVVPTISKLKKCIASYSIFILLQKIGLICTNSMYFIWHRGILSMAWCPQDPDLLLSCAKDNRILCWNPNSTIQTGEVKHTQKWNLMFFKRLFSTKCLLSANWLTTPIYISSIVNTVKKTFHRSWLLSSLHITVTKSHCVKFQLMWLSS